MAGTTNSFDSGSLQAVSNEMQDVHAVCSSIQAEIDYAKSTLGANWTGVASQGYGGGLDVWLADFQQVQAALAEMDQALLTAGKGSMNTEDDAVTIASNALPTPSWT